MPTGANSRRTWPAAPRAARPSTELTAVSPLLSVLDYDEVVAPDGADEPAAAPPCPDLLTSLRRSHGRLERPVAARPAAVVDAQTVFPIFRTGNYAPVHDELTAFDLPVAGQHPGRTERLVSAQRPEPARRRGALVRR